MLIASALLFAAMLPQIYQSPLVASESPDQAKPSVLVFSKTAGYRHDCIQSGIKALEEVGSTSGWAVDSSEDSTVFNRANLKRYQAIVFLCTSGEILSAEQKTAFESFIRSGGGFVGIHSATDTEYDWPFYGRLIGAYFKRHPKIQEAKVSIEDKTHPATSFLPNPWKRVDEWYDFRVSPRKDVHVLASMVPGSYVGSEMKDHPIIWCHEIEGGRAFYTALGHTIESYSDPLFRRHLKAAIAWAIGARSRQ